MINDLSNSKGTQSISQQLSRLEGISSSQTKEAMVALSKIQVGDLLQGELILENEQAMLKLENGLKLLANLPSHVALNKTFEFLVVGKERQHLILELTQKAQGDQRATSIIDQTIQKLGIKDTPEMRQVIEQFIGKQLPLMKEQLIQLLHFSKNYEIPTETLTNLVSEKQVLQQEELKLLTSLKQQGVKALMPAFEQLIEGLSPKASSELMRTLFNLLRPNEVNEALQQTHLVTHEESLSKNGNSNLLDVLLMTNKGVWKDQLESVQQGLKQPGEFNIEVTKWRHVLNEFLDDVLQFSTPDQLNKINRALIHESLMVHLKAIENEEKGEIEKVTEMDTRLKQVVKAMEEAVTESGERTHLQTLENVIEVLDKYRMQGQYLCFPLQIKEQDTTGELYFFKPKKKSKQDQGLYVVLALNMPALNKVEVHLVEKSGQIHLKIKVENEVIKKQLEQHDNVLLESMKASHTPIEKVTVELLGEKIQKSTEALSEMLCHLDFKI